MSFEKVKCFFTEKNMADRLTVHKIVCDTVEHAAENIGCEPAQIAKTMSFLVDEQPIVIVCAGDSRIKNNKYKAHFQRKANMIPRDLVEKIIGHAPGGVCPFALNDGVEVYLDISLKRFTNVHTAAGSPNATAQLTPDEIATLSLAKEWIDVCE